MKKRRIYKKFVLPMCMVLAIGCSTGCTSAIRAYNKANGKVECFLNKDDAKKFTYEDKEYTILNDNVTEDDLGSFIGFIQKSYEIDKDFKVIKEDSVINKDENTYHIAYSSVYKMKDSDNTDTLIIGVGNGFYKAILSENVKDSDVIIDFDNLIADFTENNYTENRADEFKINEDDGKVLEWNGKKYKVTDNVVESDKIDGFLCILSQNVVIDASTGKKLSKKELSTVELVPGELSKMNRESINYGSICSVKGDDNSLAVEVNDKFVYASLDK